MQSVASENQPYPDNLESNSLIEALERSLAAPGAGNDLEATGLILEAVRSDGVSDAFRRQINQHFTLQNSFEAHLTGYYQPELRGSLTKTPEYPFPLYALPEGTLPTRAEIDARGALAQRGLEIAWVSDQVDLFFLQVQGSGKLRLPDGSLRELQFAGHNGHPYTAIGRELLKQGVIPAQQMSMQAIKRYLRENLSQAHEIMNLNPRYIFFKLAEAGPVGTSGAILTPLRSIALDWKFHAPGCLCHLELELPEFNTAGEVTAVNQASFFAINQDTGTAIEGEGRVDIYIGSGDAAGMVAGHLNCHGRLTVFQRKL